MKKNKRRYDDDDGRVIADMNVEGTPWYTDNKSAPKELMSKDDTRTMMGAVIKWLLVFAIGFSALVVLFVWLWTVVFR